MEICIIRAASAFLIGLLISVATNSNSFCYGKSEVLCIKGERQALLRFKNDLIDPSGRLSSWNIDDQKDCCQWDGVVCDNSTGHVLELHLKNPYADYCEGVYDSICENSNLGGKINPSLFNLERLTHLDLSYNNFGGIQIPGFIGSLVNLQVLRLSQAGFGGIIPQQIGNLSSLTYISLHGNEDYSSMLRAQDLRWVSGLLNLRHLDLSYVNISQTSDWLEMINMLPSLEELYLSGCDLRPYPSLPKTYNFTSLSALDLSFNNLGPSIPGWVLGITSLEFLSLQQTGISGPLPRGLQNMRNMKSLDLSFNSLHSSIPDWFGRLPLLQGLDLSSNQLNGTLPESLGQLSELEGLFISDNFLEGIVSEAHFSNLTNLKFLYASDNSLTLQVSRNWKPVFQLEQMELRSWQLGPRFPSWVQSQKSLLDLDLSSAKISDSVPTWFWNLSSQFYYTNLSHNQLHGEIPNILRPVGVAHSVMYLNSNQFTGSLPRFPLNLRELDVSKNSFSGDISQFLCAQKPHELKILHLGENLLSGKIPDCWMNWQSLEVLILGNNFFTGSIPSSIGLLGGLRSLHLRNNSLSGEIPFSVRNCKNLTMVDLSENELTSQVPIWMGNMLPKIMVLSLRSNRFNSEIPHELCKLGSLQILDLSNNVLSGKIPKCFNNLTAMAEVKSSSFIPISYAFYGGERAILENAFLVTKGLGFQYDTILYLMTIIDLSNNVLSGNIPEELTCLKGLRSLNLSRNHLTGKIPKNISNMGLLESLDLSMNQLSAEIPASIAGLSFLNYLNVSFNELVGKIPTSTQLQSFNATSFMGNKLCGPPLPENCINHPNDAGNDQGGEDEDGIESKGFYLSMVIGFVVGFWCLFGPLLYSRSWRHTYYRFLDAISNRLYVEIMRRFYW